MWETKISRLSLLSQVSSLIYNFLLEKKIVTCQSNERCYKWKMQYPYPAPFSKTYSKNNKWDIITAFYIMILK